MASEEGITAVSEPEEEAPIADVLKPPGGRRGPSSPREEPDEPEDVEMEFFDHLDELRRRLLRSIVWGTVGMGVCWYVTPLLMRLLTDPLNRQVQFYFRNLYDPFMLYVKVSLIGGLILFAPLILYEIWAFVAPALTRREKKFLWFTLPFAVFLFFLGVAVCYLCIPLFLRFFLPYFGIGGPDAKPTIEFGAFVSFMLLCFLAFGACFQMPLIVIFLAKLGIVDYALLSQYRRHAYFIVVVVASIVTPTWDPFTMLLCAIPVCLLYELSIWIVRFFVRPF